MGFMDYHFSIINSITTTTAATNFLSGIIKECRFSETLALKVQTGFQKYDAMALMSLSCLHFRIRISDKLE